MPLIFLSLSFSPSFFPFLNSLLCRRIFYSHLGHYIGSLISSTLLILPQRDGQRPSPKRASVHSETVLGHRKHDNDLCAQRQRKNRPCRKALNWIETDILYSDTWKTIEGNVE